MDKAQLESLIQREAEKYSTTAGYLDSDEFYEITYRKGASLLAPALLEALGALEKITDMNGEQWMYEKEADQALQRIKELLGEK